MGGRVLTFHSMDPITHTVFGAAAAHGVMHRRLGRWAIVLGGFGGALPDVDLFWGFLADPALPWEYHRHFTHALAFVPIGGLIAAAPLLVLVKSLRSRVGAAWIAASLGCATHCINDTFTSFGTLLYWPFSSARVAWDVISIIDPLFSGPLLLGLLLAVIFGRAWPTRIAFALSLVYVALGFVQNQRVLQVQEQLAEAREQELVRGRAMPTFGNIIVWRSVYEDAEGYLHADAVRPGLFGPTLVQEGESTRRVRDGDVPRDDPFVGSYLGSVFERFNDFADGYVAQVDGDARLLGDMRYSTRAHLLKPMWGLRLSVVDPAAPARWVGFAQEEQSRWAALEALWRDIARPGEQWRPVGPGL